MAGLLRGPVHVLAVICFCRPGAAAGLVSTSGHSSMHLRARSGMADAPDIESKVLAASRVAPLIVSNFNPLGWKGWMRMGFTIFSIAVLLIASCYVYYKHQALKTEGQFPKCGLYSCLCCLCCTPATICCPIDHYEHDGGKGDKPEHIKRKRSRIDGILAEGESLEFLNTSLKAMWPKINSVAQEIIKDKVTPMIQEQVPTPFQGIHFERFTLGEATPSLGPIKAYEVKGSRSCKGDVDLRIECRIEYHSDVDISIECGIASAGIRGIHFVGDVVIKFTQHIDEVPIVGGVVVYFLTAPRIDLDFTGLLNIADAPGISSTIRNAIDSAVAERLVMPNQICVPLGTREQGVDLGSMKRPAPIGFVQVRAVSASGLTGADWNAFGKRTSDPFVKVVVGSSMWQCSPVYKTCDPEWPQGDAGEVGQLVVYDEEQMMRIDVWDYDMVGSNDLIGVAQPQPVGVRLLEQKDIPLYPTHEVVKNFAGDTRRPVAEQCGSLTLQMAFMKLVPGEVCGDNCLLWVKVDSVYVPKSYGKQALVAVAIGEADELPAQCKIKDRTAVGVAPKPKHTSSKMDKTHRGIISRLHAKGKPVEYIAEVTGLIEEQVKEVIDEEEAAAERMSGHHMVDVFASLHVPFPQGLATAGTAEVKISICGPKGEAIGLPLSVALADIAAAERCPDGHKWMHGPIYPQLKPGEPMSASLKVEVSLAIVGTRPRKLA